MKEKINDLIPKAIEAITICGIADNNTGEVKKEFKGYISSIGASIIQAGLLPTLAFFQNSSGKKADSSKVLKAILFLIKNDNSYPVNLITYIINKPEYRNNETKNDFLIHIEEEIMDAIIAIKLAVRTFKFDGDE